MTFLVRRRRPFFATILYFCILSIFCQVEDVRNFGEINRCFEIFSIDVKNFCLSSELFADEVTPFGENWIVLPSNSKRTSSDFDQIEASGKILAIDDDAIFLERKENERLEFRRRPSGGIVLDVPVDSDAAKRFLQNIREINDNQDHIWLTNNDEFSGCFQSLDCRFAYILAFNVEFKIPRRLVRAVRWGDRQTKEVP